MTNATAKHKQRRGVAAVELALLLPFLLILLLGSWEVGRMVEVNQVLDNAVREGARQAASGQLTNAQIQQVVVAYLQNAGLPTGNVVVTVTDLTAPGTDATAATQMDHFQVTVSMPFNDVRWVNLYLVSNSTSQLNAQATWFSLVDQVYPTTVTMPPGY
jgi:Flp pilus assembly protein TadG